MARGDANSFVAFGEFRPPGLSSIGAEGDGDIEIGDAASPDAATEAASSAPDRLIIAIDFGTTFSSVAYIQVQSNRPTSEMRTSDISCITDFPYCTSIMTGNFSPRLRQDVPTDLWYNLHANRESKLPSNGSVNDIDDEHDPAQQGSDPDDDDEEQQLLDAPLLWGFGVHTYLQTIGAQKDDTTYLSRFKLLLEEQKDETADLRRTLKRTMENLTREGLICGLEDLIRDFLHQLMAHTRQILENVHVLKEDTKVEHVISVPAVWSSKARRIMHAAMCKAVQASGLGRVVDGVLDTLFIVSEPEAAATCVLEEAYLNIEAGETIVIIDAGGGTIDAATYTISDTRPLRLSAEVVLPKTRLCGGSYVNEEYKKLLLERLKDENYLTKPGETIESIVDAKVVEFENLEKRHINTELERFFTRRIYISGLRANQQKRFGQNQIILNRSEMKALFEPSLQGASELLVEQLQMAKEKKHNVTKVMLTGGFGKSLSLQARLESVLDREPNAVGQKMKLVYEPHTHDIASSYSTVARGAALRAVDKKNGPSRITSCSYGFLITEPYQPTRVKEHGEAEARIDQVDGEKYIEDTIRWLIQKDDKLDHYQEFGPITVTHTFAEHEPRLVCHNEVFESDHRHPSHYRYTHVRNEGAQSAGVIEVDVTFLRERNEIKLEKPSARSTFRGPKARKHWAVQLQLVMIVEGRNLRYEARWPVPVYQVQGQSQGWQVREKGQISIAAAFRPGTN